MTQACLGPPIHCESIRTIVINIPDATVHAERARDRADVAFDAVFGI
jgi:hypothetical protein